MDTYWSPSMKEKFAVKPSKNINYSKITSVTVDVLQAGLQLRTVLCSFLQLLLANASETLAFIYTYSGFKHLLPHCADTVFILNPRTHS